MLQSLYEFIGTYYPVMIVWYVLGVLGNAQLVATCIWSFDVKDPERHFWLYSLSGPVLWFLVNVSGNTKHGFAFPGYSANRMRSYAKECMRKHKILLAQEPRYRNFEPHSCATWEQKFFAWRFKHFYQVENL